MWANDTNYTVVKNGVVVLSGTGPAMRVENNRLVIRDGPKETPPLCLSRAEASRKLRHVVVCSRGGGYVTLDAFEWLRDTGVSFSQLDGRGGVVIASGPRGPDRPALRRAQILLCNGIVPHTAVVIAREILSVKVRGQAHVARLLGAEDTAAAIERLAEETLATAESGVQVLATEATAAAAYWKLWESLPVRFARRNPQRLDGRGRWRAGRSERWLTFGPRTSLLTGSPFRATTPGNALLNYLYALLECEMTIALLAVGLDPGIGIFHADVDRRSSLAHDAIEAVRPYVDCWLAGYLASSAFANRDFTELADGEVRIAPPLNAHLAHTTALWRKACEPVAGWLAQAFGRRAGIGAVPTADDHSIPVQRTNMAALLDPERQMAPLPPPLPTFVVPGRGHRPMAVGGGLKDNPVPRTCHECGRALMSGGKRRFCSATCVGVYRAEMRRLIPAETEGAFSSAITVALAGEKTRSARLARSAVARQAWERAHHVEAPGKDDERTAAQRAGLRDWYTAEIRPRLVGMRTVDIARALDISRVYARHIIRGEKLPHPRHFAALARLAGIELPKHVAPPKPLA